MPPRERILAGHLPLWNPHVFGGMPYHTNPEAMLFYPLKLPLTLLLDAEGHVRASWSGVPADLAALKPQLESLRQY